ncbi:MAG: hypothetical protein ABEL76_02240, partial [Bradymonadaceae bacterium]
ESATLSVELGGGIDIETVSRVNSEENAAKMKTKIEEMAKNSEGRAQQMLTMMGATPLLENLEVSQEGKAVVATTSLSEKELDTLIERAKQFMAARRKGAMRGASGPKSGGKTKGGATKGSGSQKPLPIPSKSPSGKEGKSPSGSGSTGSGASGEEGVEADFN